MIGNMCVGMESAITLVYIAHYCTERKGICEVCRYVCAMYDVYESDSKIRVTIRARNSVKSLLSAGVDDYLPRPRPRPRLRDLPRELLFVWASASGRGAEFFFLCILGELVSASALGVGGGVKPPKVISSCLISCNFCESRLGPAGVALFKACSFQLGVETRVHARSISSVVVRPCS